jgi:hypothetical protein
MVLVLPLTSTPSPALGKAEIPSAAVQMSVEERAEH